MTEDTNIPDQHWLENMAIAAPIHAAAGFVPDSQGRRGIRPYMTPVSLYAAWRAGREMDKKQLSKTDAAINAGLLANSIAHITEPLAHDALAKKIFNPRPSGTFSLGQDVLRGIFGTGEEFGDNRIRNRFMTLGTLGLALPLYMYYRQGLKPEARYDYDPGRGKGLHGVR